MKSHPVTAFLTKDNLVFSPAYNTNLPAFGLSKPFALDRGIMVLDKLACDLGATLPYTSPEPLTTQQAALVHSSRYLQSLCDAATWIEIFELKDAHADESGRLPGATRPFPELLEDILLKSGGTLTAAHLALKSGMAANLGGGYHHAFPDFGRGFCVINDVAIAVADLLSRSLIQRAMIVDLDFHQGDGTAFTFAQNPQVFTLSIHSEEGWPEDKQLSSLDIAVKESEKHLYLDKLEAGLNSALSRFSPDFVMIVDGSDAYEKDVLPGTKYLRLPLNVMKKRDELVLDTFIDKGIPLASVFAGGYGPDVWEVHYHATKHLLKRSGITFDTRCDAKTLA